MRTNLNMMKKDDTKTICETCGGSGQISFFQGVSRFLLSTEDCPNCAGLGFLFSDDTERQLTEESRKQHSPKKRKIPS